MSIILRENEKIIKEVRQFGIVLLPRIVFFVVFCSIAIYVSLPSEIIYGAILLAGLAVFGKVFTWSRTVLTITNQRIACNVQEGLFTRHVIEILKQDIKELSYVKKGIVSTLFGYGNLVISTPTEATHIFEKVPHPEGLVEDIHNIR